MVRIMGHAREEQIIKQFQHGLRIVCPNRWSHSGFANCGIERFATSRCMEQVSPEDKSA